MLLHDIISFVSEADQFTATYCLNDGIDEEEVTQQSRTNSHGHDTYKVRYTIILDEN